MYTTKNFKTKTELKKAVATGEKVTYFQPGIGAGQEPQTGTIYCEGPHYPQPHKWYAKCEVKDGAIVKVN